MSIAAPAVVEEGSPEGEGADSRARSSAEALFAGLTGAPPRRPGATYRVQLHKDFRFDDVLAIVDYLDALGVTDVYCSPYLHARPGSTHGYDVFDHAHINPEIGDDEADARLAEALRRRGMGRVLDVVPNHMGIAGPNPYWLDVLESGPHAAWGRFFDIDWHPVKEELANRVLLPILEDHYGKVLESGLIELVREGGAFFFRYHDRRLPLAPRSYALVLGHRAAEFEARFDPDDEHVQEYRSIWAAAENLPDPRRAAPRPHETLMREKEVIKRRLDRLCREAPALREFLDGNVAAFRGTPGDPAGFDALDRLLERQVYRLAYWRVAADEINYRRFFDVNDLAGLRMEDAKVFDVMHRRIIPWAVEGRLSALRIDHPDGLANPVGYLERLQEALLVAAGRRRFEAEPGGVAAWEEVEPELRRLYRSALEADPSSPAARWFPVVVEKILSRGEPLPADWPIDGTVGYKFLNVLNALFIDPAGAAPLEAAYAGFTGDREPVLEVLYESKQLIMRTALASELNMLARRIDRVSETDRNSRDFTHNDLRRTLREVIACFPVYRTYIRPGRPVADRDRAWIDQAIARARRRNPTTDASVFAFVRDALLLEHPTGLKESARAECEGFVMRFQQITGPAQAKGLEDTAFYRSVKLTSANEVGADPLRFGASPSTFHALNAQRLRLWPAGLSATATHDTKRGEDTRLRIDVLSELPEEWKLHLSRWGYWNARMKREAGGAPAPDPREEYLLYQSLLGAWPFGEPGADEAPAPAGLVGRLQGYLVKAAREAKVNTSWTDSDPSYVEAMEAFVAAILEGPDCGPFLRDFRPFQRKVARIAVVGSLAQVLLKVASPGVPDLYQGTELWDFSLVDPDNRRPVDYGARRRALEALDGELAGGRSREELARRLLAAPADGRIKLYVAATALRHRRENAALYSAGAYRPIDADGERKNNVVAFARAREGSGVLAAAARLVAGLMGPDGAELPIGAGVWGDTRLVLPETPRVLAWRDELTGRRIVAAEGAEGPPCLLLGDVFGTLPVALLVPEEADTPGA